MSALSTITSSLPNLLTYIQGSWDVQYRQRVPKDVDLGKSWDSLDMCSVSSIKSFVSDVANAVDDGWESLDFDSFIDMNEVNETQITQQAIEGGSFRSVNKVIKPKQFKVTLAKAGIGYGISDSLEEVKKLVKLSRYGAIKDNKAGMILTGAKAIWNTAVDYVGLDSWKTDIKLAKIVSIPMEFRVVTPFDMTSKLNLVKVDYTFKKDSGRNMLIMFLTFEEVLEKKAGVKKTTETLKSATDSSNVNGGLVTTSDSIVNTSLFPTNV